MWAMGPAFFSKATGSSTVYLDSLAVQPHAAFALKKVISTATKCVRVQRSSDSTQQDFGFVGDNLDTAGILAFVGAGTGGLAKWYDQTGGGQDFTANHPPTLVTGGAVTPYVLMDGVSDDLGITTLICGTPYIGLYFNMQNLQAASGFAMVYELSNDAVSTGGGTFVMYASPSGGFNWAAQSITAGGTLNHTYTPLWASSLDKVSILYDTTKSGAAQCQLYDGGTFQAGSVVSGNTQTGNYRSDQNFYLGNRARSSLRSRLNISSFAIYNADSSAIRSSIEAALP